MTSRLKDSSSDDNDKKRANSSDTQFRNNQIGASRDDTRHVCVDYIGIVSPTRSTLYSDGQRPTLH